MQEAGGLPGRPEITAHGWLATDSPRETNPFQFQVKTCPPCQVFLCQSPSRTLSTLWLTLQKRSHTLPSAGLINGPHLWESEPGEHDAKVCSSSAHLATSRMASVSFLYQLAWTAVSLQEGIRRFPLEPQGLVRGTGFSARERWCSSDLLS